ncbi:uroporphyrinogen-III synthase [Allostreptomyces psammosilenae]|uniref:uroporphyrinogen-III C-methyltransferase n=1 Tax=Allostreptomyces psammosilenae TaxID=1892865 RepID=A0A852ZTN0_9ACTN|nr:uroporphyrinogen-III synthase [Allostreptomyces psammosilenae]NYI05766.1 uroporphyrinogen III methyltransferase/synthase [Allostreptomyces psammosilenae]
MSPTTKKKTTGQVTFLGAGPGDPGLLTLRAVEVLATADVLVAEERLSEVLRRYCPDGVEVVDPAECVAVGPVVDLPVGREDRAPAGATALSASAPGSAVPAGSVPAASGGSHAAKGSVGSTGSSGSSGSSATAALLAGAALATDGSAPGGHGAAPVEVPARLRAAVAAGKHVVRAVPGDPGMDGAATREMLACAQERVLFEIVPGIAPVAGVPAYAGVPLHGGRGTDVRYVEGSGLDSEEWQALGACDTTLLLSAPLQVLPGAAADLVTGGRKPSTPVSVTVDGSTTRQRTWTATLGTLAAELKAAKVLAPSIAAADSPMAITVVGDVVERRSELSWFETKPLFGWQVLVPRTKEQAASLSEQLRSYGAVPHEVPTIAVEPPRTPQQMERAIKGLVTGRYEWIAFTSVNAVRAVREKFEEYGLDARAFAGIKVAAVGEQTARALVEFGVKPDLVPSGEQSAAGLLEDWPPYDPVFDPIDRVFLPRADIATETLVAGLIELGWEVDDVTAYRTVRASPPPAATREAIKGGGFDAVLFTSSSTVRNLVGIAGKPHNVTVIACIGPATAKTAEEHGLRVDVLSPEPSVAALAEALADFGAARRDAALAAGESPSRPSQRRAGSRRKAR